MKNLDLPRVGFAAFVGILVGSAVAMNLGYYFWWVGVLVGIAMGIFALGPIRTIQALVQATSIASREIREVEINMSRYCSISMANMLRLIQFLVIAVLAILWVLVCVWFDPFTPISQAIFVSFLYLLCSMVFSTFLLLLILSVKKVPQPLIVVKSMIEQFNDYEFKPASIAVSFLLLGSPLILPFWGIPAFLFLIYCFLVWSVMEAIPATWKLSWKFARVFFLYIHSEETVQVSAYVAIGTLLGWYFKAPFSAAIIGGVVGELSYRFLTLRFLRQRVSA